MNNISILVGAGIISLAIVFTFSKEEKVIVKNSESSQVDKSEYMLLENRLIELQNKIQNIDSQDENLVRLQNEIKNLKAKMVLNDSKDKIDHKEIKGTTNIHTYLNGNNIKEVSNFDKSNTVYKENKDSNVEPNKVIPPDTPSVSFIDTEEKKLYYSVTSNTKNVSVLTTAPSTNEDVLKVQSSSANIVENSSPPVPPALFDSQIPDYN